MATCVAPMDVDVISKGRVRCASETGGPIRKKRRMNGNPAVNGTTHTKTQRVYPSDWPALTGDIDLAVHDLPHASADTEWWYLNTHVETPDGRQFSAFASFFRCVATVDKKTGDLSHYHALSWGIVDVKSGKHYFDSQLPQNGHLAILEELNTKRLVVDHRIERAMREMCERGEVPKPDRKAEREATVGEKEFGLDYSGCTLTKDDAGRYHLHVEGLGNGFDLVFAPGKQGGKPYRQGHDGVVKLGRQGDEMFYYFFPNNVVSGSVNIGDERFEVEGTGWYDHEFGGEIGKEKSADNHAWNWVSTQLVDGTEVTATQLVNTATKQLVDQYAVLIMPDGSRRECTDITFETSGAWMSTATNITYPTQYRVCIDEDDLKMDLTAKATVHAQECITVIAKPAFWEGRVDVTAVVNGSTVAGLGFVERHGFSNDMVVNLDLFFKAMSKMVLKSVENFLPKKATLEDIKDAIASPDTPEYVDGLEAETFRRNVVEPIRSIVDRGGKSWRSYGLMVCIDIVGGDSQDFVDWVAMPELMHVGSLIIDDVQDESDIRRGGITAHKKYGPAVAINAGCAAYFWAQLAAAKKSTTDAQYRRIMEFYFQTMRAGHTGQAADIYGLDYTMDSQVENGTDELEKLLVGIHRLKSAVPAGNLARIGAVLGRGTENEISCLGKFFESLGIAFQIIDDILNLRGFKGKLKNRGEDISAGKVTYPVAKCMTRMNKNQRKKLWETVKSRPSQPEQQDVIDACVADIEKCGALDASVQDAQRIVDEAWETLQAAIPASYYSLMLRAFSWYVLDRMY